MFRKQNVTAIEVLHYNTDPWHVLVHPMVSTVCYCVLFGDGLMKPENNDRC
jgi:hypothetical protein